MRRLLAALLLTTAVSCGGLTTDIDNTVTGTWRGTTAGQTFVLALQQAGLTVAGTGTVTSTTGTKNLSISGAFQKPTLTATINPNGGTAITLQGTVEGRSFVGTLSGGGFSGEGLALQRD